MAVALDAEHLCLAACSTNTIEVGIAKTPLHALTANRGHRFDIETHIFKNSIIFQMYISNSL